MKGDITTQWRHEDAPHQLNVINMATRAVEDGAYSGHDCYMVFIDMAIQDAMRERTIFAGYSFFTEVAYGLAKRVNILQIESFRKYVEAVERRLARHFGIPDFKLKDFKQYVK